VPEERSPRLWAIVGATGTGKTAFSLAHAVRLAAEESRTAEIVNADAMQLYRGMDIGTAKLPSSERRGIAHHLFDIAEPHEEVTVARYQALARDTITRILSRGHDAILVGGSGLYVSSVLFDFQFPPRDEVLRASLEADLERAGVESLVNRLEERAPEVAAKVDIRNPRRVVRALEVVMLGGDPQVELPGDSATWHSNTEIIGLRSERAELVERLDRRVEQIWRDGLLDEVAALIPRGLERGATAARAIGYAQALAELRGEMSRTEAIAETQALTRRYARRQVSWFKRYPAVHWRESGDAI